MMQTCLKCGCELADPDDFCPGCLDPNPGQKRTPPTYVRLSGHLRSVRPDHVAAEILARDPAPDPAKNKSIRKTTGF